MEALKSGETEKGMGRVRIGGGQRRSTSLPIVLVAALLIVGLAATDVVPASAGPTASVAKKKGKKKCSKKKRKKHKCGKGGNPVAALTALFAGSSFSSTSSTTAYGDPGSYTNVIKFCRNGTYQDRTENIGTGFSGTAYDTVTTYAGTWKFTDVLRRKTGELKGTLLRTVDSWQDSEGHAPPPPEALPFYDTVVAPVGQPNVKIGELFPIPVRTPGGAGC
jgi:hypothetical protein